MLSTLKSIIIASVLTLTLLTGFAIGAEPVNINTADAEQIAENLKGIGSSKAEAIVAYRDVNGAFQHPDELINVKGIGMSTVDKNRDLILTTES